ncbi:MAG: carboxypeptidase regulatory-like domain-containing protein [Deltaproteobacteria bacterium]|nr:carboxypeptidase regulatory-like domain-containing protein [Deltaproteobacteria bacterium]
MAKKDEGKVFICDVSICNGCYCCQIACKDEHVGNDWTPYARPQPDTGQFWLKLEENIRGTVPKVKMHYVPIICMHCDDAPCMEACSIDGAIYRRDDGLVIIDPVKCTGCRACVDSCPYHAIYYNEGLNLAQKCTGCAHLLDDGWKEPRCVDACPTQALKFGSVSEFKDLISKAKVLNPEYKTKPRVYYLNIPGKFIAGTVYDPVEKVIVKGAECTLTESGKGKKKRKAVTDGFGDFWFEGLKVGRFNLKIEAKGFAIKTFDGLSTEKDINLGDIPL